MGGPRLDPQTESRIIELYWYEEVRTASKILEHLEAENQNRQEEGLALWVVPLSPRTVHRVINESKKRRTPEMDFEDTPWSLAKMDKANISWDDVPLLLGIYRHLLESHKESPHLPRPTVRDAKWCVHIKKAVPELSDDAVWRYARRYSGYERVALLTGSEMETWQDDAELALGDAFPKWEHHRLLYLFKKGGQ